MTLQRHILYGLFLFFLLGFEWTDLNQAVQAQQIWTPVYTEAYLENLYWSSDSSTLVFQRGEGASYGAVLAEGEYLSYDVDSETLMSHNVWPLQPLLSPQEQEIYNPTLFADDYLSFPGANIVNDEYMFVSPNERFMLYITGTNPRELQFALADRSITSTKTFDILVGNTRETDTFFALWSGDSQSVVIGNNPLLGDFPRYFYITNYANNIQTAAIDEIYFDVTLNGREYSSGFIEDISQDGKKILMTSLDLTSLSAGVRDRVYLATYRFNDSPEFTLYENAFVRQQNIKAVAFDPNDERYLLVALTQDGIQRYNTIANTWEMVNADITSPDSGRALFSPDGQYLAIQSDRPTGSLQDIYVIDLSEVYEPPVQLDPYPDPTPAP